MISLLSRQLGQCVVVGWILVWNGVRSQSAIRSSSLASDLFDERLRNQRLTAHNGRPQVKTHVKESNLSRISVDSR
jgi:hypothetical protein